MSSQASFTRGVTLLTLTASLLSIGCGSSVDKAVEQTTEQTYEIDSTGTFGLRNTAGMVRIQGSDDANMKVRTTKKAWNAEQLSGIAARVLVQTKSVSIETSYPPQKTWQFSNRSGSVDYSITLPRTIKIARLDLGNGDVLIEGMRGNARADLVNGKLVARNCFGDVQLSVANGALDLFYEKWQQRPFAVDSSIIAGNARVFLPRATSFQLLAETVDGNVSNHYARPEEQDSRRARKVNMSIGAAPRPAINIRATHGDIEIAAVQAE
jgi:DUF4097 and DUF4098 domain-containing protein YvlB